MAFKKTSVRGKYANQEATAEEVEELTQSLCELVDQEKHDKAARHLIAWLKATGYPGAGLLTTFLAISVLQTCVNHGARVDDLERRVPPFSGIDPKDALFATMHAQDQIMKMLERAHLGENEQPTGDELGDIWHTDQFGVLVLYYYLQCLVSAAHLPHYTDVLLAADVDAPADIDLGDVGPGDARHVDRPADKIEDAVPAENGAVQDAAPRDATER